MEYALVARWLLVFLALYAVGVPLAATLFPRLADRGVGLALPLALTPLWLVGYWLGHRSISLGLWAGLGVLALTAALLARRRPTVDVGVAAETAVVFTAGFLFVVAIRAVDPAVNPFGGEKFLDYGLLRTLLRAEALPPEDMWFAGQPVSYYYGGQFLASLLTRLTNTPPRFAYNLALAGFYGMLVTAAYGLAGSIAAARGGPRRVGAVLGVFFVGVASNVSTAAKFVVWLLPDPTATWLARRFAFDLTGLALGPREFYYWNASRIIPGTINEFPLFSWLNGDLHAHMLSTPFMLLVVGVCVGYYLTPTAATQRRRLLVLGVLPALAGVLAVVNTWSYPTVGGLVALTLVFAPSDPRTLLPASLATLSRRVSGPYVTEVVRVLTAGAFAAAVLALGFLWSLPFWFGTATTQSVALFPDRSRLGALLLVHGGFLLVFGPYLLRHALGTLQRAATLGVGLLVVGVVATVAGAPAVALFLPLVVVGWVVLRIPEWRSLGEDRFAEPVPAHADGGQAASGREDGGAVSGTREDEETRFRPGFEALLVVAGAGLVLLVEFVFVEELAGPGRLNTVFKTYMQVWVLWGVAAGAILTLLLAEHRPEVPLATDRWRLAFRGLAAVLVLSLSLYGALALPTHFAAGATTAHSDGPTLDATAFVAVEHPSEAPAIEWLDDRRGQPTIVSAPGSYRWDAEAGEGASAAASLTGLPTVVGWHHEVGYRGSDAYQRRVADVETIYTGDPADQAALLAAYDVQYVYVGPAERATYGTVTVDELPAVTVAESWDEVTVYEVDQSAL